MTQAITARTKLPSSTNRPNNSAQTILTRCMSEPPCRNAAAGNSFRESSAKQGGDKVAGNEGWQRPILTRPGGADTLTQPERAEGREQNANNKLEGVLGDRGNRSMQYQ